MAVSDYNRLFKIRFIDKYYILFDNQYGFRKNPILLALALVHLYN